MHGHNSGISSRLPPHVSGNEMTLENVLHTESRRNDLPRRGHDARLSGSHRLAYPALAPGVKYHQATFHHSSSVNTPAMSGRQKHDSQAHLSSGFDQSFPFNLWQEIPDKFGIELLFLQFDRDIFELQREVVLCAPFCMTCK